MNAPLICQPVFVSRDPVSLLHISKYKLSLVMSFVMNVTFPLRTGVCAYCLKGFQRRCDKILASHFFIGFSWDLANQFWNAVSVHRGFTSVVLLQLQCPSVCIPNLSAQFAFTAGHIRKNVKSTAAWPVTCSCCSLSEELSWTILCQNVSSMSLNYRCKLKPANPHAEKIASIFHEHWNQQQTIQERKQSSFKSC